MHHQVHVYETNISKKPTYSQDNIDQNDLALLQVLANIIALPEHACKADLANLIIHGSGFKDTT